MGVRGLMMGCQRKPGSVLVLGPELEIAPEVFKRASSTHTSFNHRSTNKLIKDVANGVY